MTHTQSDEIEQHLEAIRNLRFKLHNARAHAAIHQIGIDTLLEMINQKKAKLYDLGFKDFA